MKKNINITIDLDVYTQCKIRDLNISATCEALLRSALNCPKTKEIDLLNKERQNLKAALNAIEYKLKAINKKENKEDNLNATTYDINKIQQRFKEGAKWSQQN